MDFSIVWQYLPIMLEGAWVTLWITVVSLLIGLAFAIPLALARLATNPFIASPAYVFVLYFRGTPLLVQIFLFITVVASFGTNSQIWVCGVSSGIPGSVAFWP